MPWQLSSDSEDSNSTSTSTSSSSSLWAAAPVKRGRGRPRKVQPDAVPEAATSPGAPSQSAVDLATFIRPVGGGVFSLLVQLMARGVAVYKK